MVPFITEKKVISTIKMIILIIELLTESFFREPKMVLVLHYALWPSPPPFFFKECRPNYTCIRYSYQNKTQKYYYYYYLFLEVKVSGVQSCCFGLHWLSLYGDHLNKLLFWFFIIYFVFQFGMTWDGLKMTDFFTWIKSSIKLRKTEKYYVSCNQDHNRPKYIHWIC